MTDLDFLLSSVDALAGCDADDDELEGESGEIIGSFRLCEVRCELDDDVL